MPEKRTTVRDLRRHNRALLLAKLYFDGPLSRHELGQLTGLSPATVSNVTAQLVDEQLATEAGLVESDGGRPRVLLRVNPDYGQVAGVDIGETGVRIELFDLGMRRLATAERAPLPVHGDCGAVVSGVVSGLREVMTEAGTDDSTLLGLGIGVPGIVEQGPPVLVHSPTIGWDAVPLVKELRSAGVTVPVFVDNGAKTQGRAEMWFGAGRGARHAVIVLVGSGLGAAVVTDGATYRGATSSAGEWGHTTIVYGGARCRCGARGCLEAYAGAEAILARYRKTLGRPINGRSEQEQFATLLAASERTKGARKVLDETTGYLGAGMANLINLFNPERIVLGGWAGLAIGREFLPSIRRKISDHALYQPFSNASVVLGKLGEDGVAVGAAIMPIAKLLNNEEHIKEQRQGRN